jgi:hypothetical protein
VTRSLQNTSARIALDGNVDRSHPDELDAVKRLAAETAAELDALLPALLDRAFKGEL